MPIFEIEFTVHVSGKVIVGAPTLLLAYQHLNRSVDQSELATKHADEGDWYISYDESHELDAHVVADYEVMPDEPDGDEQ